MKVVILAGGFGTRLSEETALRPKPMVEIGDNPILWHIMKIYAAHGFKEFVILLGYKSFVVKEFFFNYHFHQSDLEINLSNGDIHTIKPVGEDWTVSLIDTGLNTMTGGRLSRVRDLLGDEPFMLTYGDGVSDVDISGLIEFHKSHGGVATMTTVMPEGRFGSVEIDQDSQVSTFNEKPRGDGGWINAGFFVFQPEVFEYLSGSDDEVLERDPLQKLAENSQLYAYRHDGFWRPMDTLRDNKVLSDMWLSDSAPWKVW